MRECIDKLSDRNSTTERREINNERIAHCTSIAMTHYEARTKIVVNSAFVFTLIAVWMVAAAATIEVNLKWNYLFIQYSMPTNPCMLFLSRDRDNEWRKIKKRHHTV